MCVVLSSDLQNPLEKSGVCVMPVISVMERRETETEGSLDLDGSLAFSIVGKSEVSWLANIANLVSFQGSDRLPLKQKGEMWH